MRELIRHIVILVSSAILTYLGFAFVEAEWINLFEQDEMYRLNYLATIFVVWVFSVLIHGITKD